MGIDSQPRKEANPSNEAEQGFRLAVDGLYTHAAVLDAVREDAPPAVQERIDRFSERLNPNAL